MEILEQLQHLKAMTVRLGALHEAQVVQLRNYPLLIPGVAKAETKVYPDDKYIVWSCKTKKNGKFKLTNTVTTWCKNIERMTRVILWDDTKIKIIVNGRTIYGK